MDLLVRNISDQQMITQVPAFVGDVVKANQYLSSTGFGQISDNSADLYAGRWLDNISGRVRVLPEASDKMVNPVVL